MMHCAHKCDQDLLTQLNILSRVMPHDAISTNNASKPPIRIQKPGMQRSVERFFAGENRRSNIVFLQQLFLKVVERYDECQNTDETMRDRLVNETRGAIRGMYNLQQSYEGDAQFQACMDVSIKTVTLRLKIEDEIPAAAAPAAPAAFAAPAAPAAALGSEVTESDSEVQETDENTDAHGDTKSGDMQT